MMILDQGSEVHSLIKREISIRHGDWINNGCSMENYTVSMCMCAWFYLDLRICIRLVMKLYVLCIQYLHGDDLSPFVAVKQKMRSRKNGKEGISAW